MLADFEHFIFNIAKHCILYILYILLRPTFIHVVYKEEVREKIEGQQYTSIVPSSMGATVHELGQKYQPMSECISRL